MRQAMEGAGSRDSPCLCLSFSLWATILPPLWAGGGGHTAQRLWGSHLLGFRTREEAVFSWSCGEKSPKAEADWCGLSHESAL